MRTVRRSLLVLGCVLLVGIGASLAWGRPAAASFESCGTTTDNCECGFFNSEGAHPAPPPCMCYELTQPIDDKCENDEDCGGGVPEFCS